MRFNLPSHVEYILATLEAAGYHAHIVGGSVRDLLLGKNPDDFDITTSALPEETKAVFSDKRTVDTGIKHGTVSLILDGKPYEITTYRLDGEYKDSRHPEAVYFTKNIVEDLSRRDFTVNAMAYNPTTGLVDPFGGRDDLKLGIIRAVGDPYVRFNEDALRILRGIRFSSVLGFKIEDKTSKAIREKRQLLSKVSAERIYVELKKMLSGIDSYSVVLNYPEVITQVLPMLDEVRLPDIELFSSADYRSRILSLFYLSTDNPTTDFDLACHSLRTDTHFRKLGVSALFSVGKYDLSTELGLTRLLRDGDISVAEATVRLEIALGMRKNDVLDRLFGLIDSGVCYKISDLKIGGGDLIALGARGRRVGEILDSLLTAVIEEKLPNERDALISYVTQII